MTTIEETFALASQHFEAGQFQLAENDCRQLLQQDPWHADAYHLLGVVAFRASRFDQAAQYFRQALALIPSAALYHFNLGLALAALRQMKLAAASFQQAVYYRPNFAEAHNALGNALRGLGKLEGAVVHCRLALNLQSNYAEAHANLGLALSEQGKLTEAGAHYRQALALDPNSARVHNNFGNVLVQQGNQNEAVIHYFEALRVRPNYAEAHCNLANALTTQGSAGEAAEHAEQALQSRPDFPEAYHNLGVALQCLGKLDDAETQYENALRLRPSYAETHLCRGLLRLLRGDFARGWSDYEGRWTQPGGVLRTFTQPRWDGSDLGGRTILLHAEQGLGDTIQFIRFAPLVKQRGGNVVVECQPALLRLLSGMPGVDQVVARGSALPAFDVQAPLLSVPGILQTNLDNLPAAIPYLHADPALVEHWRSLLQPLWNFKIGIAWQGRPDYRFDRQRSIPLARFARLAGVKGVTLISLQKGPGTDQLVAAVNQVPVMDLSTQLDKTSGGFLDTAAVMKNLDLVISSDTAVAHLAGALGIPVWVAVPLVPDWRWLLQREDSPWYTTLRLFRQTQYGHWEDVFERMAEELEILVH